MSNWLTWGSEGSRNKKRGAKDNWVERMMQRGMKKDTTENDLFQLSFIQFHSHKSDKLLPTISSVLVALKPRMLKEIVVCINIIPRIASCRTDKVNNVTESQSHLWVFQWVGWSHNNFWTPLWRRPLKYSLMDYCYGCAFIIINRTLQSGGKRYGLPDTWIRKWVYFIFC